MKTKRFFGIIAFTVIFAMFTVLSLTGCGDDDSTGDGNGNGNGNGNGEGGTSSGGPDVVTVTDNNIGTWTISAIAFGKGKFVVGINGQWSTSTDGVTWTARTGTLFAPTVVAYGADKFLAGAISNNGNHMWYSSDGINWTDLKYDVPWGTNADVRSIVYGGGKFVAGGTNGAKVVYSNDGITWNSTDANVLGTTDYIGTRRAVVAIAYGGGKYVAGGTNNIAYSSDGIAWTTSETSELGLGDFFINVITYGKDKFVAGGNNGKMAYSSDGVTWTAVTGSPFVKSVSSIAYGNGKYIAGGTTGKMATSTDGVTWTALPDDTFGITDFGNVKAIAYGNGKFVAVGYTSTGIDAGKMVCLK
jgi:hypothetical protein